MVLARWQATILDDAGNTVTGASIEVQRESAGAPLATIYSDRDGATPLGNPFLSDSEGFAAFHAPGGAYRITATKGVFSRTWRYVGIGLAGEEDASPVGVSFRFDSPTADADPGSGNFRLNNATPGSATTIFFDTLDTDGNDQTAFLDSLDDGGIAGNRGMLILRSTNGALLSTRVTGTVVAPTGYRKVSIVALSASAPDTFIAGSVFGAVFTARGADGLNGTNGEVSSVGASVTGNLAKFNDTTGDVIGDSGKSITTLGAGKQTIWVPAAGMFIPGGAASQQIINVGGLVIPAIAFDPATTEFVYFTVGMPKSWNEGNLTAQFYWTHPAATTNFGVVWQCAAAAFGDNDPLANVYVAGTVVDIGGTANNLYVTAETGAIDPGNAQAEGDLLPFFVARSAADGNDTLATDAYLIGAKLFFTTDVNTDN